MWLARRAGPNQVSFASGCGSNRLPRTTGMTKAGPAEIMVERSV